VSHTDITILNIPPRLLGVLGSDLEVGLGDEVLEEHFGRDGDDEGGIVGAVAIVRVDVDDLLDAGDCGYPY
jgi:hypothetical protein